MEVLYFDPYANTHQIQSKHRELHVENSNKYREQCFLQILFLYIFISGILLELNPWYAVVVYISLAVLSLVTGIYSIVRSARENSSAALLTIPIGVVTTIFSVIIISFTVFAYFYQKGMPSVIQL